MCGQCYLHIHVHWLTRKLCYNWYKHHLLYKLSHVVMQWKYGGWMGEWHPITAWMRFLIMWLKLEAHDWIVSWASFSRTAHISKTCCRCCVSTVHPLSGYPTLWGICDPFVTSPQLLYNRKVDSNLAGSWQAFIPHVQVFSCYIVHEPVTVDPSSDLPISLSHLSLCGGIPFPLPPRFTQVIFTLSLPLTLLSPSLSYLSLCGVTPLPGPTIVHPGPLHIVHWCHLDKFTAFHRTKVPATQEETW